MKKLIALLCILALMLACAACSNNPSYTDDTVPDESTDPTYELRDPQQEEALPSDDLSRYAITTGALTNYRIAVGYTSDVENIVTVILHDGKNQQNRTIITNKINSDGTAEMSKYETVRYVWNENSKYTSLNNGEEKKTTHAFDMTAEQTTLAVTLNELVCPGFYEAIITNMSTSVYDIIGDCYKLDGITLIHNDETWMFDDISVTVSSNRIESIHCSNGTQTITIELTGVNNVDFGGNE